MKTLWILALVCLAIFVVDAKKDRSQKLKKWELWNHIKKAIPEQHESHESCRMLTARLLDWFHILRSVHQKEQWKLNGFDLPKLGEVVPHLKMKDAKMPFPSGSGKTVCREPIHSVFNYVLDQNTDGVLDEAELADIYEIGTEPCIKAFFKDCAKGRETFTEAEFCSCFTTAEPPCLQKLRKMPSILLRGESRPLPGIYTPSCDEDGFYIPRQCRAIDRSGNKECWCVDRNGGKIEGLEECVDNTEPPKEEEKEEEPVVNPGK